MIFSSFHFRLYYQKCREVKLCFYSVSQAYRLFFLPKNLPAAASIAANPKVVHPTGVSLSPVATAFSSLADGVPFVDGVSSGDSELSGFTISVLPESGSVGNSGSVGGFGSDFSRPSIAFYSFSNASFTSSFTAFSPSFKTFSASFKASSRTVLLSCV